MNGTVTFVAPTPQSSSDSNAANTSAMSTASSSSGYEIQITLEDYDEKLRIGMTAKTSIILESAQDVYAVAYDCVKTDDEGKSYIEAVNANRQVSQNHTDSMDMNGTNTTRVYVETGMESDYYIQIISDELYEGMQIVATESSGDSTSGAFGNMENMNIMPGTDMGGDRGGNMGGNPGGGMPGGGF